ncbi:MAG: hypothetical protein R3F18_19655 [Lysobacterales bacterium]|nr:hypothetical protein [Rhodanobacteraceae bacterium]
MTAARIIEMASAAGLSLEAKGPHLSVRPAGKLTAELRYLLATHKPELMVYLGTLGAASKIWRPNRAWTILLSTGERFTAVNTTNAGRDEMLALMQEQFGGTRVCAVEEPS